MLPRNKESYNRRAIYISGRPGNNSERCIMKFMLLHKPEFEEQLTKIEEQFFINVLTSGFFCAFDILNYPETLQCDDF